MKKLKKTLSLALAGCMAASMLVTGAFAADMPSYSDVPANAAYAEAVEYLSAGKIMDGIGDGKFGPQDTVTRAMAVTVLGCMAGAEEAEANAFTDVVPNSWYSGYVGWASENGIVQGDGSGRFMPDRMVTSEELNLMLGRYAALAEKNADLYDTGAATVTRADLAQRLYALAQADSSAPVMPAVVQLDKGYIMGYEDNGIYTFKGLPYGTADRFKSSVAVESYGTAENPTGTLTTGAVPPQGGTKSEASKYFLSAAFMTPSDSDMYSMEDQCLNLNVWTDSLDEAAKKPVLVFMHGGGTKVSALSSSPRAYEEKLFSKVVWASGGAEQGSTPAEQAERAHAVADTVRKHPNFINYIRVNGNELGLTDSSGRAVAITPQTTLSQLETIAGNTSDAVVFAYMQTVSYDILGEFGLSTGGFTADGDLFVESGVWATDEGMNEIAKNYSYMFGTAWAETGGRNLADSVLTIQPGEAKGNLTEAEKEARMREFLADRVGEYDETLAVFEAIYPGHDFYDLRSLAANRANYSDYAAKNAKAVYNYFVAYEMPYFGGMTMIHTGDVAYWFHSIDVSPNHIRGDEDNAHKLADTMASALAAFCATGDPSTAELQWKPTTPEVPQTMVFDVESVCKDGDYNAELLRLIQTKPET